VTLTCQDLAGNMAACSGVVTVRDVTPPAVTVGTPNRTLQCNRTATYQDLSDVSANDLCSNPVTMLARTGTVSMGTIGTSTLTYSARDTALNVGSATRTVDVLDTLKPMLFLNGEEFVQTQCFTPADDPRDPDGELEVDPEPYIDPGAIGDDQCYGDVTPSVITSGEVNKQSPGVYTLEYHVRDGAYNWADPITRTVEVIDNLAPVLVERDPLQLTPVDNTLRTVEITECVEAAWDVCEGYLDLNTHTFDLTVTSNDASMDPGDVVILSNSKFQVRVRHNVDTSSRVYTATYMVTDSSGNVSQGECTLNVAAGFTASR
jgi:large repetitive protein